MLTERGASELVEVEDPTDVSACRRRVAVLGSAAGLDEARVSDAAIVASEMASNILKHAGTGGLVITPLSREGARGLSIIAWDRGPGFDVERCLVDGVSTRGTAGQGLGAIRRLATHWQPWSSLGQGAVIGAELWPRELTSPSNAAFEHGGIAVPYPGETACGDAFFAHEGDGSALLVVVDGLGHGPQAAAAARVVLDVARERPELDPIPFLERAGGAARATRGAACAVVKLSRAARTVEMAGVGNIAARLWSSSGVRSMVSQHGTLGQAMPRLRSEKYPCEPGTNIVLASDGLKTNIDLPAYASALACGPATIAALLWRDFSRGRDDATVAVLRSAEHGA